MFEYEPLRATGILAVAMVASMMWVVRDKMVLAMTWRPNVKDRLVRGYMKLRGIQPYEGRHRLA